MINRFNSEPRIMRVFEINQSFYLFDILSPCNTIIKCISTKVYRPRIKIGEVLLKFYKLLLFSKFMFLFLLFSQLVRFHLFFEFTLLTNCFCMRKCILKIILCHFFVFSFVFLYIYTKIVYNYRN